MTMKDDGVGEVWENKLCQVMMIEQEKMLFSASYAFHQFDETMEETLILFCEWFYSDLNSKHSVFLFARVSSIDFF